MIQAEVKRLGQETRFLEEELEQLEIMEKASVARQETNGPCGISGLKVQKRLKVADVGYYESIS